MRTSSTLLLLLLLGLISSPVTASGEIPSPPFAREGNREADPNWDWVQMATGEWLKGEITRMRDKKLYFDSDEFGDQDMDWSDVETLITSKPHAFRLVSLEVITGSARMQGGTVRVQTAEGVVEFEPTEVLTIVPGDGRELDNWHANVSANFSRRNGNTDQLDVGARAEVRRESTISRFVTSYAGDYSEFDGDKNANSHRMNSALDFFLTRRFYVTVPSFEYFTDEFQNIDYRLSPGAGLGYELLDTARIEWDVSGGISYQYTKFKSVETGGDTDDDVAAIAETVLNFELTKNIDWDNRYTVQIVTTGLAKTNHHAESIFDFDIWGPLDLEIAFIFDRIESPQRDGEGETPKSNDYRTTVGLALDF
jgi:putative salt-induced outer membrane protein YdiY